MFPQIPQALPDLPHQRIIILVILIDRLPRIESEIRVHLQCSIAPFVPALGGVETPPEEPLVWSRDEGHEEFPSADDLTSEDVCTEFEVDDEKDQAL